MRKISNIDMLEIYKNKAVENGLGKYNIDLCAVK